MKIVVISYDIATGGTVGRVEADLKRFVDENPNSPPQYVIRQEIREIGAYITETNGIRTEVTKL
jgi:hypothetical protein